MRNITSAPLIVVAESQQQLVTLPEDSHDKTALKDDEKSPCSELDLKRPAQVSDDIGKQENHIKAPFIRRVPVPSFTMDDVNIDFSMEVTSSENIEADTNELLIGPATILQGTVRVSTENTRSTERSEKHQVSVSLGQQQQEEGIAKLIDIMGSCIKPLDTKE